MVDGIADLFSRKPDRDTAAANRDIEEDIVRARVRAEAKKALVKIGRDLETHLLTCTGETNDAIGCAIVYIPAARSSE